MKIVIYFLDDTVFRVKKFCHGIDYVTKNITEIVTLIVIVLVRWPFILTNYSLLFTF